MTGSLDLGAHGTFADATRARRHAGHLMEVMYTLCSCCAEDYGVHSTDHQGIFEGPASSAAMYGWATLERQSRRAAYRLATGYELTARYVTEKAHLCPRCLADDAVIDDYRWAWQPSGAAGIQFERRCDQLAAAEAAEEERLLRMDALMTWLSINGAPRTPLRGGPGQIDAYARYRDDFVHA